MADENSMESGYQNWLISRQIMRTRTPESPIKIPPGLHLSTRRGPEVELYDVTGVHLLSAADSSAPVDSSLHGRRIKRWRSRLCWRRSKPSKETAPVVLTNNKASDLKSAGSSDYTLGRLPTKTSHNDSLNPARQGISNLFTSPPFSPFKLSPLEQNNISSFGTSKWALFLSCDENFSSCFKRHQLDCSPLDVDNLPNEHRNYYKHCFTLLHHRAETSILLFLTLLTSLVQAVLIISNVSREKLGSAAVSFTMIETSRLGLFSISCMFALLGLICVNWQCWSQSTPDYPQSAMNSFPKEDVNDSEHRMAYHLEHLLTAQQFDKQLRVTYVFVYLSCLCLASAMLPWFPLAEISSKSTENVAASELWYRYNCSNGEHLFTNSSKWANLSNPLLQLTPWYTPASNAVAPADCIWVILWITVAVHGLLDLDRLWSRRLPYAFTVTLALGHLILTNVFHMIIQSNPGLPPSRAVSTSFSVACAVREPRSVVLLDRISWWDNLASLMGRQNVASLLALVAAHLVGQVLGRWTARHRYGLFLLASQCQAKLDRLTTMENKLMQLANSLVPAPLAKDLAQDFVAGYLTWSSPLVIYLRNVSFISVELVGLSTVASVVASATGASAAASCQQFVAFLNDLFGCFDRLANVEGCYRTRLNAAEYMCIAGYPETRVDHARSCVDFGLAVLKTVNELSQMTNVQLELRAAVHTGAAYTAVLGRSRLGFELTGADVDFVSQLRRLALRPGRVLTSRATFAQLPEGFRGEPGPTVPFPGPALSSCAPVDSPRLAPCLTMTHMVDTFFVQPRGDNKTKLSGFTHGNLSRPDSVSLRTTNSPDPVRSNVFVSGLKSVSSDWPKLTEFSLERVSLLNRLSSSASVICRRPVQEQDTAHPTAVEQPLDFLFNNTTDISDETSKEVQCALLQTLCDGDLLAGTIQANSTDPREAPLDRSTHSATEPGLTTEPIRDPSTTELLAMAAVTLAKSFGRDESDHICHDKNIPCQRRAGRLRGKCPTHTAEVADSTDGGSGLGADNSMGTSLATMTTTAMNPSLPSQDHATINPVTPSFDRAQYYLSTFLSARRVSWLGNAPPGQSLPHWLTLRIAKQGSRASSCWPSAGCTFGKSYASLKTTENPGFGSSVRGDGSNTDKLSRTNPHKSPFGCCSINTDEEDERGFSSADQSEQSSIDSMPRRSPFHCLTLSMTSLIPLLFILGLIHLILVSKSYLYMIAYFCALVLLGLQILLCVVVRRFSQTSNLMVRLRPSRLCIVFSILFITGACAVNLIACSPGLPLRLYSERVTEGNLSYTVRSIYLITNLHANSGAFVIIPTFPVCPIPGQFMLLCCTGLLVVALAGAASLYPMMSTGTPVFRAGESPTRHGNVSDTSQETHSLDSFTASLLLSQPIRFTLGALVLVIYTACLLWSVFRGGALHEHFESGQNPPWNLVTLGLMRASFVQHLLAFGAFALLAFMLPRGLEFQCVLFQQWLAKYQSVTHSLTSTRLALARLLLSVVPRYVIPALCIRVSSGKSISTSLYAEHYTDVGIALVDLTGICPSAATRSRKNAGERASAGVKSSTADEPAQIADRLRLVNHVISLLDSLVDDQTKNMHSSGSSGKGTDSVSKSTDTSMSDPRLVKVFVGGTVLGYAVGLLPPKTTRDQSSRSKKMTALLRFAERVLQVCEEANAKTLVANGLVHARVALHSGPAVVGLIGKHRPTYGVWGESVQLCLRLLHESQVPALNCQHLILATDEVMNSVAVGRLGLNATCISGQQLIWRCVDSQTGQIVPSSTQIRSLPTHGSAPGGPTTPRSTCLPLHFCSIPVGPSPSDKDVQTGESTARALFTLAQRTTSRSTDDFEQAIPPRRPHTSSPQMVSAPVPDPNTKKNVQQAARMSQVPADSPHGDLGPTNPGWGMHTSQSDILLFGLTQQPSGQRILGTPPVTRMPVPQSVQQFHGAPPPPPHQRPYPSSPCAQTAPVLPYQPVPTPGAPADDTVIARGSLINGGQSDSLVPTTTPFAQLRSASDRKCNESNNVIVNRRRGVVSQFPPGSHDYSIVNTEPPTIGKGPNHGRVTSQVIDRRQTQPVPGLFDEEVAQRHGAPGPWNANDKRGEYWSNCPPQMAVDLSTRAPKNLAASTVADKPHQMLALLSKPENPGDLRPISLSSTDSFLAAERACAASDFGEDPSCEPMKSPLITTTATSGLQPQTINNGALSEHSQLDGADVTTCHHNPMYTDNEYESMTESQGNLVDVGVRTSCTRSARSQPHSASARPGKLLPEVDSHDDRPKLLNVATGLSTERTGNISSPVTVTNNIHTPATVYENKLNATSAGQYPSSPLNFPDIQRPSSPCAGVPVRDRIVSPGISLKDDRQGTTAAALSDGLNSQGKQPPNYRSSSASSASSVIRNTTGAVCQANGHGSQSPVTNVTGGSGPQFKLHQQLVAQTSPSTHCSDSILLDQSKNGATGPKGISEQKFHNAPALILWPTEFNSPDTAEQDGTDAEYLGTYSLGPASLAVQPSIIDDGLTSCDGEELVMDDEEDPYGDGADDYTGEDEDDESQNLDSLASSFHQMDNNPLIGELSIPGWSPNHQLFPSSDSFTGYGNGMTDSLLANPDLDARDSELGDEFDLVGSLNAPPTSSSPLPVIFDPSRPNELFGRIKSKQAPEFLEAALLPPLPTPSCTNGCDTNTKELYSIPPTEDVLTSDTDDLFAYHIRPGMDQNPATAIVAMQSRGPQFAINDQSKQNNAISPITACLPMSPMSHLPGRPTVSSHAVLRLNPQATRPTLPDIAPVSLPDFAQPLGLVPQTETNGAQSDYDNVCMSTRQRPARSKDASVKPGCASARKLAAGARRRANRWQSLTPGDESDAMSGYIGDAASSAYDTEDDDDDYSEDEEEQSSTEDQCDVTHLYIPHPPSAPAMAEVLSNNANESIAVPPPAPSDHHPGAVAPAVPVSIGETKNDSGILSRSTRTLSDVVCTPRPTAPKKSININRTPSSAESQTSGPEMRSEYDNVNTNGSRGGKHSSEEGNLNKKSTSPSLSLQHASPHRTGSFNAKRSEITQRLFDSEIAAEARRISRQFRAMGWLPATSSVYSPVAQHSPTEVDKAFGIHTAGSALPNLHQKPVAIARPHLFLLPMDVSVSNPCSRQTSFRNRPVVGSGVGDVIGGSMMDSETMTTVTSQFDDEDDEENDEFAPHCGQNGRDPNGFLGGLSVRPGENGFHVPWDVGCDRNSPDAQLGCLLVRPRSLSATCLSGGVTADTYRDPFLSSSSSDLSPDAQSDEERDADGQNEKTAQNSGQAQSAKQFDKKSHIPVLVVRRPDQLPGVSTYTSGRQNSHLLTDSSAVKRPDVSPGLTRLQRRAARVRSLIPPDLLPYILPSCMSSPSRSSSMVSSAFGLSGIVFLSLARSRRSRQKMNRLKRDRSVVLEINRRRCTSDPELNLTCR